MNNLDKIKELCGTSREIISEIKEKLAELEELNRKLYGETL